MEPYWVRLLTQESLQTPEFNATENVMLDFWTPITMEEIVEYTIKGRTAPNPDGLTAEGYARIPVGILLSLFNLLL